MIPRLRSALRLLLLCTIGFGHEALAQTDPYGPGLQPGIPAGPDAKKKKPEPQDPNAPEMHAAPGAMDSLIPPGSEPSLPSKPLSMPKKVQKQIGSDVSVDDARTTEDTKPERYFYGPYYEEVSEGYRFRVAFPVWAERTMPSLADPKVTDRASLFGGLYYNRRSAERADDILFPLMWNLVDKKAHSRTTVVGPFVNRDTPEETDNWLAPFYFTGTRKHGGYTIIPPLLTMTHTDGYGGFNMVGPYFCDWKGGEFCDTRTAQDIDFGFAPLYFYGQNKHTKYEVISPLLHYYRFDNRDLSWVNVWGPYYRAWDGKRDMLHLLPLYYSLWGPKQRHTTVLPFFHYGYNDNENESLFVNPLYLIRQGSEGERTFVTWGYARHRGRTELDMITPLYWDYRDPDADVQMKLLFPFLYSKTSPRESSQAFFPFWGRFERFGIEKSTWITPLFRHATDLRGWSTNIYPLVYFGRTGEATHSVVAPIFWDFADPESHSTVVFPAYWRFATARGVDQLTGNVYYRERRVRGGLDWQLHIFPLFSYGEMPDGHFWNVLFGLAGYTRQGAATKMRTLWIPIPLSSGASSTK